ncbi:RNase A-like domain-containing protein [Streptomyces sp. CA-251247]|uniref:RNase A-like domain-containing protein n=1 Tax=Streptomyces sp. CA-251247 TaxID=3240062 RepID=UPI003D8E913A
MAGPPPPSPSQSGTFDIKPTHVYHASDLVRDGQYAHDRRGVTLVDALNKYTQSAGTGSGADSFADAYKQVVGKFLEAWGKGVVSIGGAAVGLTVTANNYGQADWDARGRKGQQPVRKPEPVVINKTPPYGPVNDIKWTGTGEDADSWAISGVMGEFPDFLADVIRPAVEHGLRLGKVHEITPGAKAEDLRGMAVAWRAVAQDARKSADELTDSIAYLTDPQGNSEWQGAMRAFCQTIWGTTEWGRTRDEDGLRAPRGRSWKTSRGTAPAGRRPIIEVLEKTANAVQEILDHLADVADKTRGMTTKYGKEAGEATFKDLTTGLDLWELTRLAATMAFAEIVITFRSHMDKTGMNAEVENYHREFNEAAAKLNNLKPELDVALRSAPTFQAEQARAQAFGARSLNEFKKEHRWQRDENQTPYVYSLDLATNEELSGGHTIDKHVGKTDSQLLQRLEDQANGAGRPSIPAASSFPDLESAQRYTQHCIRSNTTKIQDWLKNPPPSPLTDVFVVDSVPNLGPMPGPPVTGRISGVVNHQPTPVTDAHGVSTRLKYDPDLDPPFVVVTSMPA